MIVERCAAIGNVGFGKGARNRFVFRLGMGQGTLSFSKRTQTRF
jgi:hypothetical protein